MSLGGVDMHPTVLRWLVVIDWPRYHVVETTRPCMEVPLGGRTGISSMYQPSRYNDKSHEPLHASSKEISLPFSCVSADMPACWNIAVKGR